MFLLARWVGVAEAPCMLIQEAGEGVCESAAAAIGDELRQARGRLAPSSCTTPPYVAADARLCPRGTAHKGFVVEQRPTSLALVSKSAPVVLRPAAELVTEGDGGVQDRSSRTEGGAQPASPVMSAQGHAQHAWQAPAADTSSSHGANPKPPSPPPADDGGWGLGVSGLGSVFNWGDSTDKKESHSDGDSAPFGFASWF